VNVLPVTLVSPGRRGLNKERSNDLLSPEWATDALNCVLSREGRIAARKGWLSQTTGAIASTPSIKVLFEYLQADGTATIITAANNKIYKNISDYTVGGNNITAATPPTADDWQFVNFNGKVIGVQTGHTMIKWSGSGSFTLNSAASGSLPAGNAACAAFGRLWVIDSDTQTVKYSALLDETKWATADGGGSIDLRNVWTKGMDQAIAVAAFGANLIVFGRNHVIIYADGSGSTLGIDPLQMYVVDTIEGTGCVARDSVQPIGEGDLAFLSRHGIQLLGRTITEKSNPTASVSKNIRSYLQSLMSLQSMTGVRSIYSPEQGFYALLLPTARAVVVADTRFGFQDDDNSYVLPMLAWTYRTMPTAMCVRENGNILLGFAGKVGLYSGNLDNTDSYSLTFSSPWLQMDPRVSDSLKILKELPTIVQLSATSSVTWVWEFDFNGHVFTNTATYTLSGVASEFNISEYNIAEFSGGLTLQSRSIDGQGEGQFIRVGLTTQINSMDFVLQQIKMLFKIGRMAA
jgi:hypothetical protein